MTNGESEANAPTHDRGCRHDSVSCLNPYELIRKYRCSSCDAVTMCACDEDFGRRFLPHQLASGTELSTRRRVLVTHGFTPTICPPCRGVPEEPHPKAKTRWSGSLIERFYWREIAMETTRRYAAWSERQLGSIEPRTARDRTEWARIRNEVIQSIRAEHERAPKYDVTHGHRPPSAVLSEYQVTQIDLKATYAEPGDRRARVIEGGASMSVEQFVTAQFERKGSTVIFCESRVFHAIFGTFMWLLVNDPADPNSKMAMFGRPRENAESGNDMAWMQFPLDFGSESYGTRRVDAVAEHMTLLHGHAGDVMWLFDYWQAPSARLRRYLHAWEPDVTLRARRIVELLPWPTTEAILRYLIEHYWGRYLGWPDLAVFDGNDFFFAEVKSSKDVLHPDQQRWVRDNAEILRLPFKLVKVHRANPRRRRRDRPSESILSANPGSLRIVH